MKAVVFHDVGDIRLEEVKNPEIIEDTDVIVRLTHSAICGTDLHMIRGSMPGMSKGKLSDDGIVLGHEGVGKVEKVGNAVKNFEKGDRVIIPSTIACGHCEHCKVLEYAQCDHANPNGPQAGTAFFGGPKMTGPFDGLQAEKARIPYADTGLVKVPDGVSDDHAILLSDILPTAYMGAEMADIYAGDSVAVFGCGPVGLLTILSAKTFSPGKVFAIDTVPDRLEMAEKLGAIPIDYNKKDPVKELQKQTKGYGPMRVIDAVGIDANQPLNLGSVVKEILNPEQMKVAPKQKHDGPNWHPGNAPFQVLNWAVQSVCKSGTISIIGVYPQTANTFPIGAAMNKNLTLRMGNCNHRKYIPMLLDMIEDGEIDATDILTKKIHFEKVIDAYKHFDLRADGWIKVDLNV